MRFVYFPVLYTKRWRSSAVYLFRQQPSLSPPSPSQLTAQYIQTWCPNIDRILIVPCVCVCCLLYNFAICLTFSQWQFFCMVFKSVEPELRRIHRPPKSELWFYKCFLCVYVYTYSCVFLWVYFWDILSESNEYERKKKKFHPKKW